MILLTDAIKKALPPLYSTENVHPDEKEIIFKKVFIRNTTKGNYYGHLVVEITGSRSIPLDDGEGHRTEQFVLRVPLTGAVVGPKEVRAIPLKDAVVPGKVNFLSVRYKLVKVKKVKPKPPVVIDKTQ